MARVLAVCVGLPKDIAWRNNTVHTGVWKHAVEGPRMVRRLNIDGDGQGDLAGHGGEQRAVLIYQIDSYRHWQEVLGREDFEYGQFGENLTVEGLPDDEVCIGDHYRIGGAVLEVTQPRVTGYRVGIRMEEPRLAALMVADHRPGFYLRVVTEGLVEAGDEIVKVASGPESVTVADIDALLYLPGAARADVARAQRIPALSPGWKTSLQDILDAGDAARAGDGAVGSVGLTPAAASPPPAWSGFQTLRVARRETETTTVVSLWLAGDDGSPLPPARPGQFVTLRLRTDTGEDAPPLIRSYSLSGPPGSAEYRISIKLEPGGRGSNFVHDRLHVGDTIEVAAPRGVFMLRDGDTPVLLASTGIGATPVLAMLHALAAQHATREIWWLHGARNRLEHAFADEARALLSELPNAYAHVCYSRPGPDDRLGEGDTTAGRLSAAVVAELDVPRQADVYLCGPTAFMDEFGAALTGLRFDPARVHTETFGTVAGQTPGIAAPATAGPPHPPPGPPGPGPAVSFARSGLDVRWSDDYADVLELAEACNVPTRWSCRTGVCHTCETAALTGSVTYLPEPIDPPENGNILICCARPQNDLVLDL